MTPGGKLAEICAHKRAEVAARKQERSLASLEREAAQASPARGFTAALAEAARTGTGLVAEIKRASPSKGLIRADFDPAGHARDYAAGGAACLSVLTDEHFFQGSDEALQQARAAVDLPVLRKDFTLDPWQVVEARALGSDAVLLIAAVLDQHVHAELDGLARELGMDVLVEVHDEEEMERAVALSPNLLGINNRNLRRFSTDLAVTEQLAPLAPEGALLVSESGIANREDCRRLAEAGVRCVLIGESLMRQPDLVTATRSLLGRE